MQKLHYILPKKQVMILQPIINHGKVSYLVTYITGLSCIESAPENESD